MKKIVLLHTVFLLITVSAVHATNTHTKFSGTLSFLTAPDPVFHSGLRYTDAAPKGYYSLHSDEFFTDMKWVVENDKITAMFQYQGYVKDFVRYAKFTTGNSNLDENNLIGSVEYIAKHAIITDKAPEGFRKEGNTSGLLMALWTEDYSSIGWRSRDPYQGEKWIMLDGQYICSLTCGNFLCPQDLLFPPKETGGVEDLNRYGPGPAPKPSRFATGGATTVNVNVYGANAYATGGTATNTGSSGGQLGGSNLRIRSTDAVDPGYYDDRRVVRQSYQQNEIRYSEPGIGTKNVGIGIGSILHGGANLWRAINNDRQDINLSTFGYQRNDNYNYNVGNRQQNYYCYLGHRNCNGNHNNQNNGPWHGATNLNETIGTLPVNLYNNGTGVVRGTHLYSNNASTQATYYTTGTDYGGGGTVFVPGIYSGR